MPSPEKINDDELLTRWAYHPAVNEPSPLKGLQFQSSPPHSYSESFNWKKHMPLDKQIHKAGVLKQRPNQAYLGYYETVSGAIRSLHKGMGYETTGLHFTVTHTPNENIAHTDVTLIKGSAHKGQIQQAKIDLARDCLSELKPTKG